MSGIGQVFTPAPIARMMSDWLLEGLKLDTISVLDPGAGSGHLTEAVIERLPRGVDAHHTLVEVDSLLAEDARLMLKSEKHRVLEGDFIQLAAPESGLGSFSHAIMNPPYSRLSAASPTGRLLQKSGRYVPNLYAAFLWLTTERIDSGGRIAAIVPRSFFNGKLFRRMRRDIFSEFTITRLHTFPDRTSAFARDNVLQETVIIVMDRRPPQSDSLVCVTNGYIHETSTYPENSRIVEYGNVINLEDPEYYVRVPSLERGLWPLSDELVISYPYSVSTGKVVAYRSKEYILPRPGKGLVPLVDSRTAFGSGSLIEPSLYYKVTMSNKRLVLDPGVYVLINRFSPTERRPRLNVVVADCTSRAFSAGVAFENHLNVVSKQGGGMSMQEARIIAERLAHPASDKQFIELSGSTQVNVTDLRTIRMQSANEN